MFNTHPVVVVYGSRYLYRVNCKFSKMTLRVAKEEISVIRILQAKNHNLIGIHRQLYEVRRGNESEGGMTQSVG